MSAGVRIEVTTTSAASLRRVAGALAAGVRPPLVLLLEGDLGAGKTTFVRGFVQALPGGRDVVVQSPTYALARSYATTPRVHHMDLYRLDDVGSLHDLGLIDQLLEEDAIACVEWPRDLSRALPRTPIGRIAFSSTTGRRRPLVIELPQAQVTRDDLAAVMRDAAALRTNRGARDSTRD